MDGENILISKLSEFTRKYYKNKSIRGSLISLGILLSLYLAEVFLEYFSYLPSLTRIILVYFYLFVSFVCVGLLIIIPMLKYFSLAKTISREQAAAIVGEHFEEIGDKLLNTLQLIDQKDSSAENIDLLIASINQRIKAIKPIPFTKIINLKNNAKYLRYVIPPLFILLLLILIAPSIVSDPTLRLIQYSRKFIPPALFRIIIVNKELKAMQQEDFNLRVKIEGNAVPEEMFLKIGNSTFAMKRENARSYSFLFKALQADTRFVFIADDKETEEYKILVYPKPIILNFELKLDYPVYTGKQSETLNNIGDLIVPEGTLITWNVYTRDVSEIKFRMADEIINLGKKASNVFSCSRKVMESMRYSIFQENQFVRNPDSLNFFITVIKDAFPEISLKESRDTGISDKLFFQGTIKDDYGFTRLVFVLSQKKMNDSLNKVIRSEEIAIEKKNTAQVYFYSLDLSTIDLNPGDKYAYYFAVWDNDGIKGPKSSRTDFLNFEIPSLEKIAETTDKSAENLKKGLEESLKDAKNIGKSIDEINKRMIEQNDVSWKEKKKLEDVIKANEKILNQVEDFKENNNKNIISEKQYLETSERILEKQKKLNELANQLLTEEMKKTIQEMKDLLNQMDKNKLNDLLPRMKQMSNGIEKELDRNLQLFKQLEFERKLEHNLNKLQKLSEEQKNLADKTAERDGPDDQLKIQQENVKQKFDTIKQAISELQKQGQELEIPVDLKSTEETREAIDKQLGDNQELMKLGKMKNASKNQKETAKRMKELAQKLENLEESADEEAESEDEGALKLLLQNLNKLSFEQEDLIYRTMGISRNDPRYLQLIDDQKQIKDKFRIIEDTLSRIARREISMKSIIMKEVSSVNDNLLFSEKALADRVIPTATGRQQYAMTSMNNLSLLLDEALKLMNEQSDKGTNSSSRSSCKKPGKPGGKMSMGSMRQMQQEMNNSLEKLRQGMNKAKTGQSQTRGEEDASSKEIARMVGEQEAIRRALQEYENALKDQGFKDNGSLKPIIDDMEKNEKDFLNKRVNQETINRQQRIVTRMLESEKADEQREKEDKRESTEAKNNILSNPMKKLEYKKSTGTGKDIINFTPAPVNFYYRSKASEYILKIGK
jgi:hypothetical protein